METLLGAFIALAGAVVVQLWLVPVTDHRRRRTERWEESVLDLRRFVIGELQVAIRAWSGATIDLCHQPDPRAWTRQHEVSMALLETSARFDNVIQQVLAINPGAKVLAPVAELRDSVGRQVQGAATMFRAPATPGEMRVPITVNVSIPIQAGKQLVDDTLALVSTAERVMNDTPPRPEHSWQRRRRVRRAAAEAKRHAISGSQG